MASDAMVHNVYARAQQVVVLLQHFNGIFGHYTLVAEIIGFIGVIVNTTLAVM